MKVLALGFLPKWKGGTSTSGLSTGLFDLHDSVNERGEDYQVIIAATDIRKHHMCVDQTRVVGWTRFGLVWYSITNLFKFPSIVHKCIKYHRQFKRVFPFLPNLAKAIFYEKSISEIKPDIVHFHGSIGALFSDIVYSKNYKKVLRIHGINGFDSTIENYQILREVEEYIVKLTFDYVTFVTPTICDEWISSFGRFCCPMKGIVNGYNEHVFFPPKDTVNEEYDLITISALSERKGQDRVMKAIKKLRDITGVNLSYLIVGSGEKEFEDSLKEYAKVNNLAVKFVPYCPQPELNNFLWSSRFFILPSATEGFGKVYIESAASGTPFIIPEDLPIVKTGGIVTESNSLTTKGCSEDDIYDVLCMIRRENHFSRESVSNSVKELSWSAIASKYIQVYKSL